jgi:PAS domain S-box-containing protein
VSRTSQPADSELVQLSALSLDASCIVAFDGSLKFANPAFAQLLGYAREELLARPFTDTVHPDDRDSAGAALAELARGQGLDGFECRHLCADGSSRWLKWSTHARPDERVIYGVAKDVTNRRGAEAELNALRRIATLVAGGVLPQDLFAVVAEEVSRVVGVSAVSVVRYEPGGTATECANFNRGEKLFPTGTRWPIEGTNILGLVRDSAGPARIDDYSVVEGEMAAIVRDAGIRSTVGVPIIAAGRLWGTIVGSTTEQEPLPEDTASRLADFTELLATAIENAESREALERLADEQAALRRVATLVARGVRADEIFAAVGDEVGRLVGTESATVLKFDDEGPGIVFMGVASNMSATFPLGARWKFEDGMASAEVYRTGRSARGGAKDWSTVEGPVGKTHQSLGIVSTVASPIVVEGRLWGAVSVQSQEPLPPDTEERLEKFTELVATAIANTENRAGLTRLAEEQAALRRVATLVARGVRPAELFAAVSNEVGRLVGTQSATVIRYDDDGEGISYVGSSSKVSGAFPLGVHWKFQEGMASFDVYRTGRSARSGSHLITVDGPIGDTHRRMGIVSAVASPIVVEGRLWGAMAVHGQEPLPPGTEERLEKFTELVATAIANTENRAATTRLAEEQAALRRVATHVARGAPPAELFAVVTEEAGQLLPVDGANMSRYDPDGMFTTVAAWSRMDLVFPVGRRWFPEGKNVTTLVLETGRPARMDSFADASGPVGVAARAAGYRSVVGTPIVVEGRLWGAMTVSSTAEQPLPADTEARLASFTELVATAIANTESRAQLTASRARIVTASDETRRRIERDLHDGAQQRLVSIALELRLAKSMLPPELDEPRETLNNVSSELTEVLDELREISRGIHPMILTQGGLGPAMRTLARRSAIPVDLHTVIDERLPEPIEVAAYFVASEAVANATKHAQASSIEVSLATSDTSLILSICDDGIGGADPTRGSGLVGLADRVEAIGGTLDVKSAPGGGTSLAVTIPLDGEPLARLP